MNTKKNKSSHKSNITFTQQDQSDDGEQTLKNMITQKAIFNISDFEIKPIKSPGKDTLLYTVQFHARLAFDSTIRLINEIYMSKKHAINLIKEVINALDNELDKHRYILNLSQWNGLSLFKLSKSDPYLN